MYPMVLHLEVTRRWQTPHHSKRTQDDDLHDVKEEILKEVGKRIGRKKLEGKIGHNPNLHVDEHDIIVLIGRGPKRGKRLVTEIPAGDFLVLTFVPADGEAISPAVTVQEVTDELLADRLLLRSQFVHRIPYDAVVLSAMVDYAIREAAAADQNTRTTFCIFLTHTNGR